MLANVLDIDFESMKVSLNNPNGAIILFDFEAAFPSISQSFLLDMLQRVGLPEEVLQVVRALYWQCRCVVKVGGSTLSWGFHLSGVQYEQRGPSGLPPLTPPLRADG